MPGAAERAGEGQHRVAYQAHAGDVRCDITESGHVARSFRGGGQAVGFAPLDRELHQLDQHVAAVAGDAVAEGVHPGDLLGGGDLLLEGVVGALVGLPVMGGVPRPTVGVVDDVADVARVAREHLAPGFGGAVGGDAGDVGLDRGCVGHGDSSRNAMAASGICAAAHLRSSGSEPAIVVGVASPVTIVVVGP